MRACLCVHASVCGCGCTSVVCFRACRRTYLVCHAQAPYCLCSLWLQHILRYYLMKARFSEKKSLNIKRVFWFSLQISFKTFLILRRNQRDIVINVKTSLCQVPVIFCWILVKLELSRQIFEKVSNVKLHKNPSSGSRVVSCGRTDRRTDMTKLIVAFSSLRTRLKTV